MCDRSLFRPVTAGFEIVSAIRRQWPHDFDWRIPTSGIHNFDKLAGTDTIRKALDDGTEVNQLSRYWDSERDKFAQIRHPYLLYDY